MDSRNLVILVLLVALAWVVVDRGARAGGAFDGGGGDATRDLVLVTGPYGSGASALYAMDAKTRHLTVYRLVNGRSLEFVAARNCSYDFMLETYGDESPRAYLPTSLRQSWERHAQGLSGNRRATEAGRGPGEKPALDPAARRGFVLPEASEAPAPASEGGRPGAADAGAAPTSGDGSGGR